MSLTPREYADVEAALGLAVEPAEPSAGLKASLMAKIAETPQLAPLTPGAGTDLAGTHVAGTDLAGTQVAGALATTTPGRAEKRAQVRWFSRPVAVLTAAAAAVLLFFGGTFVGTQMSDKPVVDAGAQSLATLTGAADLQRASTTIDGGGEATLVWSLEQRKSAILVSDLPQLPAGKTYQLWYIGEGGAIPAGTFETTSAATSWRVLDGQMSQGDAVGVTVEPAGGSKQPTTQPIVKMQS